MPVRLARALRTGLALTIGFTGTLATAGLAISAGARTLIVAAPWLGLALGFALAVLGVLMLTGRTVTLRVPSPRSRRPASGPLTLPAVMVAGVGCAAASLSCTFGVLIVVIAQSQATASHAGLVAVFVAYAVGSATLLLLVSVAAALTGAVLTRRLGGLAHHGSTVTAVIVLITGAYLIWYWLPAATGGGSSNGAVLVHVSASVSTWLQTHTITVATLAGLTVLATVAAAWRYPRVTTTELGTTYTNDRPECCRPQPGSRIPTPDHKLADPGSPGGQPSARRQPPR